MVHKNVKNTNLSGAQKLQYLKTLMDEETAMLIRHLVVADLTNIKYLLNMPTIQNTTTTNIRELHDRVLESLHALDNLKINVPSWHPILLEIIVKKMDIETYRRADRKSKEITETSKPIKLFGKKVPNVEAKLATKDLQTTGAG